jgi:uncharacterized membrane protein
MFDLTNIHPMLVHFPIALLIVGFGSDVLGLFLKREFFSKVGFYLLILGTLGVIAAYFSGDAAGEGLAEGGALKLALETHEGAALLTLWLCVAAAVVRTGLVAAKKFTGTLRWIPVLMFLAAVLSVARTGHYGGQLVFNHAAGVQLSTDDMLGSEANAQPEESESKEKD